MSIFTTPFSRSGRVRRGSRPSLLLASGGLLAAFGCGGTAPPATPAPGPTEAGAASAGAGPSSAASAAVGFTAAQAARGRDEFGVQCGECHATSEFRGRDFLFRWRRRTAWDFYRNVTETMPENAPGSLSDQQYVDVIAYVLSLNGHAAGDIELVATQEALDRLPVDGADR